MAKAKEFSELRNWFARWKRDDPLGFWVAILVPWLFAVVSIVVPATLMSVFPFSDARRSLNLPPRVGSVSTRITCKVQSQTYFFGYELAVNTDEQPLLPFGRVCRDVMKGAWVLMKDDARFIAEGH
jgi:hypothetical protein